jgi:hypothetical protein
MKKIILLIAIMLSLPAMAQDSELPSQKYSVSTASFWSNWFVEAGISASSFSGDKSNLRGYDLPGSIGSDYRVSADFSMAVGKWFTPGLGLRTKWNGIWGRSVISTNRERNASKFWTLSEQALFNVTNMLLGYNEERPWDLIPYLSAGFGRNMTYNTYAMGLGAGIKGQWHFTTNIAFGLDLSWMAYEPDFDGYGGSLAYRGTKSKDRVLQLELSFTYNLGKGTFETVPDIDALRVLTDSQIDALNAQLADQQAENERLRKQLNNK